MTLGDRIDIQENYAQYDSPPLGDNLSMPRFILYRFENWSRLWLAGCFSLGLLGYYSDITISALIKEDLGFYIDASRKWKPTLVHGDNPLDPCVQTLISHMRENVE